MSCFPFRRIVLFLGLLMLVPAARTPAQPIMIAGLYSAPPAVVTGMYPSLARCLTISRDGGTTWTAAGWRGHRTWDVLCLDNRTDTVLTASDYGILRSVDGMKSWILVSPRRLVLARDLTEFGTELWTATAGGTWVSRDRGENWVAASEGLSSTYCSGLLSPAGMNTLLAATADGILRRDPGASTWKRLGLGGRAVDKIVQHPGDPDQLLAISAFEGLWISTDRGVTWKSRSEVLPTKRITCAAFDPVHRGVILLGSEDQGTLRSTDSGTTWQLTGGGMSNFFVTTLCFDPVTPDRVYAGVSSGSYVSDNGGKSWKDFPLTMGFVSSLHFVDGGGK